MRKPIAVCFILAICFGLLLLQGCSCSGTIKINKKPTTTKSEDHEHKTGPHGGLVAGVGLDDKMHVELVIDKKNQYVLFYILDEDEKTRREIPIQLMEAICINNEDFNHTPVVPGGMIIENKPQNNVRDSLFFGTLPTFEITQVILKLKVGEARYTVKWDLMPTTKPAGEEAEICLKPGGIYTAEDIKANGNTIPSIKYKGFIANHEHAKPGDWVCPITGSKGVLNCFWIVNGEKYYVCCPPCCVNVVQIAKDSPNKLKSAKEYIKRD